MYSSQVANFAICPKCKKIYPKTIQFCANCNCKVINNYAKWVVKSGK